MDEKTNEDMQWEAVIYDNFQVLIPKPIRDRFNLLEGVKIKLALMAVVKEKKREIPAQSIMKKELTKED